MATTTETTPTAPPGLVTLLHTIQDWWPAILTLAALIAIPYGWRQLRTRNAARGKATPPLSRVIGPLLRFAFREDNRPLVTRPKTAASRFTWLTGTRTYLALAATAVLAHYTHLMPTPVPVALLVLILWARYAPIARARRSTLMQMFNVAASECRYPKGADLNPWAYISIQRWTNLTSPGETTVVYPAAYQSEDVRTRDRFELQFNGTISEENTWNYKWESAKNRVVCRPVDFLPTMAPYPGPGPKWDEIVLGIGQDGPVTWNLSRAPHALIAGPTGSGKSVVQRMILFHALVHSDTWKIVGIDPKRVELSYIESYRNVLKVATELADGIDILTAVRDEMERRYEEMKECGVNHFQMLPTPPSALLCMVDETYNFLAPEGIKSDEGKERDDLHQRGQVLIGEIARLGRAAGIHLALATQRPDATVLKGEMKNNLDFRVAAGRMDTTPSLMVLDSEMANRLPGNIKGRGLARFGGSLETFQGYFAEQDWFDKWLAAKEDASAPVAAPDAGTAVGEGAGGADAGVPLPGRSRGLRGRLAAARAAVEAREAAAGDSAGPAAGQVPRVDREAPPGAAVDVMSAGEVALDAVQPVTSHGAAAPAPVDRGTRLPATPAGAPAPSPSPQALPAAAPASGGQAPGAGLLRPHLISPPPPPVPSAEPAAGRLPNPFAAQGRPLRPSTPPGAGVAAAGDPSAAAHPGLPVQRPTGLPAQRPQ